MIKASLKNPARLARTVGHIPPRMLAWRLYRTARNAYQKTPLYLLLQPQACPSTPRFSKGQKPLETLTPTSKTEGKRLAKTGTFVFAETAGSLTDWLPKKQSALWVFHLHYHDFLPQLHTAEEAETARTVLESWLTAFFDPHPTAWHPYPTSLRVVHWLSYAPWLLADAPKDFTETFWLSLFRQLKHLEKNPEKDLGGNHYIKNLKALLFGALLWPKAVPNRALWEGKLKAQLAHQVLPDGVHFERSPQYHAQVLQDMLELKLAYQHARKAVPTWLTQATVKLAEGLAGLLYPDGNLGHVNDGHPLTNKHLKRLQTVLPAKGKSQLPAAGFYRLQQTVVAPQKGPSAQAKNAMQAAPHVPGYAPEQPPTQATPQNWCVVADGGQLSPNENPGHAHAGPLAFELLVNKQRVFVNRGTFGYQVKDRLKWRGTQSYNTVQVGRQNAAEVWGTFRVGRRYHLDGVRSALENEAYVFEGTHDGYRHVGVAHRRALRLTTKGLSGADYLTPMAPVRLWAKLPVRPVAAWVRQRAGACADFVAKTIGKYTPKSTNDTLSTPLETPSTPPSEAPKSAAAHAQQASPFQAFLEGLWVAKSGKRGGKKAKKRHKKGLNIWPLVGLKRPAPKRKAAEPRLKKSQPVVAHFTLHPSVTVKHTGAHTALLTLPDSARLRFSCPSHALALRPTTYSPALGVKLPTQQLVLQCRMRKAVALEWRLEPHG